MHDELRLIWELSPVGIVKVSKEGKFVDVNPRFCEITGYNRTELLRRTFQQITHPDDLEADVKEAEFLSSSEDGESYQMVKRYISKDGRTVWISLYIYAVRGVNLQFESFLAFAIELAHVGVYSGNPKSYKNTETKPTILDYIKKNPKEAFIVLSIMAAALNGKSISELIILMTK